MRCKYIADENQYNYKCFEGESRVHFWISIDKLNVIININF
jgi:hypothetical protein